MPNTIVTNQTERAVVIYERAAMGPPGPQGPPGSGIAYVHDQPTPSDTWTINHNRGFKPLVEAFSAGNILMPLVEVLHTSVNQTIIYFNVPTAGFARLM